MTKYYIAIWKASVYGTSVVAAKNKKEAKEKAIKGEDECFEPDKEYAGDWKVVGVEFDHKED